MGNEKVDEILQFKIKEIVDFPIGGIIIEKTMDFNKDETEVKIRLKYEVIECLRRSG